MPAQTWDDITPDMALADVAAKLRLHQHGDGHFENSETAGQRLVLLGAGDLLAWQRQNAATTWTWVAGAALALSVSADGHDAQAFHLNNGDDTVAVDIGVWHTCETLGRWSLIAITGPATGQPETKYAAPDWYPVPRRATDS